MDFPSTLRINAWSGADVSAATAPKASSWGIKKQRSTPKQFLPADEPVDLRIWEDEKVGWGLVLLENEAVSVKERAVAADAPEPIKDLVKARNQAPVFRYRKDLKNTKLRRYYEDESAQDIAVTGSERGVGRGCLPRYLLIYGPPHSEAIPWSMQYILNHSCFVGRLDLEGTALENYVNALLQDWQDASCRPDQPLVWSVDHGNPDITWLMHGAIGKPVAAKLAADSAIGEKICTLAGTDATAKALIERLVERQPALVVSTSHGMTGPLNDVPLMSKQLGLLVDDQHALLQPDELLRDWQPDGAIWYSHACCSAGSDEVTSYKGLVEEGSSVEQVLQGVAGLGAQVAPFPKTLLGASKPLRAFIGQVEPTFDWTLRAETGQVLTSALQQAIYNRMHRAQPEPVGLAFETIYRHAGQLFAQLDNLRRQVAGAVPGAAAAASRTHLAALDRQSMVILGDPTVCLPSLSNST